MKFQMLLGALLLPSVVMAQQSTVKPLTGPAVTQPYRVVIQEPIATTQAPGYNPYIPADSSIAYGLTTLPDVQDAAVNYNYLLPADNQFASGNTLFGTQAQTNVRVNLSLRNAPLKEAVKQLSEQTKYEFVLEPEATDTRVTVAAKNIRLHTALDMLTDAAGLNWNQQNVKKEGSKDSHLIFRLGKKVARNLYWGNTALPYTTFKANPTLQWNAKDKAFQWSGKANELKLNYNYGAGANKLELKPKVDGLQKGIRIRRSPWGLSSKVNLLQSKPLTSIYTLNNSLVGTTNLLETRSTFTCPSCKHQVTVIHQHQAPKCDKCGRAFHDDWEFCPFDGAKRPAGASNDWQFCPICGKSIKADEKKPDEKKSAEKLESKPTR